jgi:prolyl-tRNA editing enzyme YbaK/EbsC (Cys-tRNA(Pro) deacylase)
MSGDEAVLAGPHRGLLDWLEKNGVDYELHEHPTTFTARETARADHVNPTAFAKAIGVVTDDGRRALVVLDAADRLDLLKARGVGGAAPGRARRLACPPHDRR